MGLPSRASGTRIRCNFYREQREAGEDGGTEKQQSVGCKSIRYHLWACSVAGFLGFKGLHKVSGKVGM